MIKRNDICEGVAFHCGLLRASVCAWSESPLTASLPLAERAFVSSSRCNNALLSVSRSMPVILPACFECVFWIRGKSLSRNICFCFCSRLEADAKAEAVSGSWPCWMSADSTPLPSLPRHARVQVKANSSSCPLRLRTTPFTEEKIILGVIYGVLLWVDMNTATPLGVWGRSVISHASAVDKPTSSVQFCFFQPHHVQAAGEVIWAYDLYFHQMFFGP